MCDSVMGGVAWDETAELSLSTKRAGGEGGGVLHELGAGAGEFRPSFFSYI